MQSGSSQQGQLHWHQDAAGVLRFKSSGNWTKEGLLELSGKLRKCCREHRDISIQWDMSEIGELDSAGMVLFIHYYDRLIAANYSIELLGMKDDHRKMYELLRRYTSGETNEKPGLTLHLLKPFQAIGRASVDIVKDAASFLAFIGESFVSLLQSLRHPGTIRFAAIVKNIENAGVRAMPIIALTSFLIGVVIAYQGAVQLEKFGANIFIVEMIGISITRELAPLITAIVVAGRTGSSFTAQIGVMKITEEIDAMRTMGFDPHCFLVHPRIIALMIVLPLLIFFADLIGIAAGMLIANIHLHLSYAEFINRLQDVLEIKHVWIGLIKGPFFACLIAMVGCYRGFQVSKNTESIGQYTTISVVNAIFLVIACDALFSVLLTELGI